MCGIVTTIGYKKSDVDCMLESISHRGKDNRGIREFTYNDKTIHLGHNRLSINDVSPLGNQPMSFDDTHLIVNGEIWNYPQLRKEYEAEDINSNQPLIQKSFYTFIKKTN